MALLEGVEHSGQVVFHYLGVSFGQEGGIVFYAGREEVEEVRVVLGLELGELEAKTNNHFLKIAIFKYTQTVDIGSPVLLGWLGSFSRPDQLEHLRECCVEFFEECPEV